MRLSIVVPVLDEARPPRGPAGGARALRPRCRGDRRGRRKPGRKRGDRRPDPGRPSRVWRPRPGAPDERGRGPGGRRDPPLPPRRHAPPARRGGGCPGRPRRPLGRLRPLRRPLRSIRGCVPDDRPPDEPALAPDGDLHRRPGDLRPPLGVRAPRGLPGDRPHGGHRAHPPAEAHRPLRPVETPGHDRGPALGRERNCADDRPHVDLARPLLLRDRAGPPAPLVLRSAGPRPGEREERVSSGGA